MKKRSLAIIIALAAVFSQFSTGLAAVSAEESVISGADYEEENALSERSEEDMFSAEDEFVSEDLSEDLAEEPSSNTDEAAEPAQDAGDDMDSPDALIEDEEAFSETDAAPDAFGEGIQLMAADVYVGPLTQECTEYTFTEDLSRFDLTPSRAGIYHFIGTGINKISVYDSDDNAVGTFSESVMDTDLWFVSAQLEAGKGYYVIISRNDPNGGAFYYYRAPEFCVKVTLKNGAGSPDPGDPESYQKTITYYNASGVKTVFTSELLDLWNESGEVVGTLGSSEAHYYFLTDYSAASEPVANGDGTYYVDFRDPLTGGKLGHCWDEGTVTAQPTCAVPGRRTRTCICGASCEEEIPVTDAHTWTDADWQLKSEATIFSPEIQERTCGTCGMKQTRTVGGALESHIYVNADMVPLKKGQKTTAFRVTMDEGDYLTACTVARGKIASVTWNGNGVTKIKGKNPGKTIVTLKTASGAVKNITVKVTKKAVKTNAVTVTNEDVVNRTLTLNAGERRKLITEVAPFTSQDKVTFTSKNAKIVKVSKRGVVTARKAGRTRIIVKAGKKTFKLTVVVN